MQWSKQNIANAFTYINKSVIAKFTFDNDNAILFKEEGPVVMMTGHQAEESPRIFADNTDSMMPAQNSLDSLGTHSMHSFKCLSF